MYKNILVPVDLSDVERGKACLALAKHVGGDGCKIRLLNVVEDRLVVTTQYLVQKSALSVEVPIQGTLGDIRKARNLYDGGLLKAVFTED